MRSSVASCFGRRRWCHGLNGRTLVLMAEAGAGGGAAIGAVAALADVLEVPRGWLAYGD
mgnify:CR=1 FL=1